MRRASYYFGIEAESAEAAYSASMRAARRYEIAAKMCDRIAESFAGTYVTAASAQKIISELMAYAAAEVERIHYDRERLELGIIWRDGSYNDVLHITLATRENRRINAEQLKAAAAHRREQKSGLIEAQEAFYANVQQYNAIAKALETITRQLDPIMYTLHRGW